MIRSTSLAAAVACLFAAGQASASISWGQAQTTNSAADVSNVGTTVFAWNGGGPSTTVNGVVFDPLPAVGIDRSNSAPLAGGDTGDAGLNSLLGTFAFGGGSSVSIDLSNFASFDNNAAYLVQVFYADQRSGQDDRIMTFGSSGSADSVDLEADPNDNPASEFGEFAIGTFTGDPGNLTLLANGFNNVHVNGLQVRLVEQGDPTSDPLVPEPTAIAVWSLLGVGVCGATRRR